MKKYKVSTYGPIRLDMRRVCVTVKRKKVILRPNELRLLECLMKYQGNVVRRQDVLEHWGYDHTSDVDTRSVDVTMRRLRNCLGEAGDLIETVRGFGYTLPDREQY